MTTIECPHCKYPNTIDIVKAVDENGEEFICVNCGKHFRYAQK